MQKETYERIFKEIESRKNGILLLRIMGRGLTYITAFCYVAAVAVSFLVFSYQEGTICILVPAVSFLAVSVFRKGINAERPYEKYSFKPLIEKDTKGKSFPSRHVFSIFVIGSTLAWLYPVVGIVVCLMGCILAAIRVLSGVHFPKDVVAGGVIGIACGCLAGFFL